MPDNQPDLAAVAQMQKGDELSRVSPALDEVVEDYLTGLDKHVDMDRLTPDKAYKLCIQRATLIKLRKRVAYAIKLGRIGAVKLAPSMERK